LILLARLLSFLFSLLLALLALSLILLARLLPLLFSLLLALLALSLILLAALFAATTSALSVSEAPRPQQCRRDRNGCCRSFPIFSVH
jgi:hypothetical protein